MRSIFQTFFVLAVIFILPDVGASGLNNRIVDIPFQFTIFELISFPYIRLENALVEIKSGDTIIATQSSDASGLVMIQLPQDQVPPGPLSVTVSFPGLTPSESIFENIDPLQGLDKVISLAPILPTGNSDAIAQLSFFGYKGDWEFYALPINGLDGSAIGSAFRDRDVISKAGSEYMEFNSDSTNVYFVYTYVCCNGEASSTPEFYLDRAGLPSIHLTPDISLLSADTWVIGCYDASSKNFFKSDTILYTRPYTPDLYDTCDTLIGVPSLCSSDDPVFGSNCYISNSNLTAYNESLDYCSSLGGNLVEITSQEEQDFLMTEFPELYYWIGLRRPSQFADFDSWLSGEPLNYTNWDDKGNGEPDNKNDKEACAINFKVNPAKSEQKLWQDVNCLSDRQTVCEVPT